MKPQLLAVGKDIEHFNYAKPYFMKLGLTPVLLQSMQEALEEITRNKNYIAIGINEDNINYLPQLKIMRDCTTMRGYFPFACALKIKHTIYQVHNPARRAQ